MLTDASLKFSDLQAITSTAASTNIVDLGVNTDMGIAIRQMQFAIYVGTAFVSGGGATLQVQVQGAPDSSGSPGTYVTFYQTDLIAVATLTAQRKIPLPYSHRGTGQALYRFLRLNYVVATSTFSAGTLSSYLVIDRDDWSMGLFPAGYTVAA